MVTTPDPTGDALKACPWCGERPNTDDGRLSGEDARVWCHNFPECPVEPVVEAHLLSDAVSRWNTRTPPPSLDEVAIIEEAMRAAFRDALMLHNPKALAEHWRKSAVDLQARLKGQVKAMVDEEISALEFMRDMKDLTEAGEGELVAFHRVRALLTRLKDSQ